MSVRFVGPFQTMGPVAVDSSATIAAGDIVQVAAGLVTALASGDVVGLAVALDKSPDTEYEGTKSQVDVALLGGGVLVELPMVDAGGIAAANIGGTYTLTAAGAVDTADDSGGPAFTVMHLSRDTALGDTTGYVVGTFLDSVTFLKG